MTEEKNELGEFYFAASRIKSKCELTIIPCGEDPTESLWYLAVHNIAEESAFLLSIFGPN